MNQASPHNSVIQTLDSPIGGGVTIPKEAFFPTLPQWDGTPIVLADRHPDLDLFEADPEKALSQVQSETKPRIVGYARNPSIVIQGGARLMEDLPWQDPEADKLYQEGHLGLSTAFFYGQGQGGSIEAPVTPSHILIFDKRKFRPRDPGTWILNQEGPTMPDETETTDSEKDEKGLIARLKKLEDRVFKKKEEEIPPTTEPPKTPEKAPETKPEEKKEEGNMDTVKTELAEAKAKLENQSGEVKQLREQLNQLTTAKAKADEDAEWASICNQLPSVMIHGEEEAKSRELYKKNPKEFWGKAMGILKNQQTTDPQGNTQGGKATNQQDSGLTIGLLSCTDHKWTGAD